MPWANPNPTDCRGQGRIWALSWLLKCDDAFVETIPLVGIEGVRCVPDSEARAGALVLAGSSGRVDSDRARVLAEAGVLAESIRWFGGPGQNEGPWEIQLEVFLDRVAQLRTVCDRVIVLGTSFGAEAAMLIGALSDQVDAVVAFAPSDVVWAGITGDGRVTSHWTYQGAAVPYLRFADDWAPDEDPPAYVGLYRRSWTRFERDVPVATIPVERIRELMLVAGGDDQVWPAVEQALRIEARRFDHDLPTTIITDPDAGHRTILPGEPVPAGGIHMRRGGNEAADRRLGQRAWQRIMQLCSTV